MTDVIISDNYTNASDTFWGAWSDSDIRSWLIEHGYMKSDAQARRDELVKMINDKCVLLFIYIITCLHVL